MNTGKAIKKALIDKGENQLWLAEKMGTSRQAINKLCNKDSANTETLCKISEVLELSLSELLLMGE